MEHSLLRIQAVAERSPKGCTSSFDVRHLALLVLVEENVGCLALRPKPPITRLGYLQCELCWESF